MPAVSNSSPLIFYAVVGKLDLLHETYGEILIPPAVWQEAVASGIDRPGADAIRRAPCSRENGSAPSSPSYGLRGSTSARPRPQRPWRSLTSADSELERLPTQGAGPAPGLLEQLDGAFCASDQEPSGNAMTNVLPCPSSDSAQMRPPWAATSMRLMYSPSPRPQAPEVSAW